MSEAWLAYTLFWVGGLAALAVLLLTDYYLLSLKRESVSGLLRQAPLLLICPLVILCTGITLLVIHLYL